jgi:type 1 fimbriae regulatory protein FimB
LVAWWRREYLSVDEIEKLLVAAKSATRNPERDYCALLLMFRHGLRVSELCISELKPSVLMSRLDRRLAVGL